VLTIGAAGAFILGLLDTGCPAFAGHDV